MDEFNDGCLECRLGGPLYERVIQYYYYILVSNMNV